MKLWMCCLALTLLGLVAGEATSHGGALVLLVTSGYIVPGPRSALLLATGLISLALLTTIGRPPFRLKF